MVEQIEPSGPEAGGGLPRSKPVQIYNTHARVSGLSLDALHAALLTALHSMAFHAVAHQPARQRYVVHTVHDDGTQAMFKLHILPDDTDPGSAWWLNVVPCRGAAHQSGSTGRHAVFFVYATLLTHESLEPYVDAAAVHPAYTPLYTYEQHMTPWRAAAVCKTFRPPSPPPPSEDEVVHIDAAFITSNFYPMLFTSLKAWALTQLLAMPPAARAAAAVPDVVSAFIHQQLQRKECSLAELVCASKLCEESVSSKWLQHVLAIVRTAVCAGCVREGWQPVATPVVYPSSYAAAVRCLACAASVHV